MGRVIRPRSSKSTAEIFSRGKKRKHIITYGFGGNNDTESNQKNVRVDEIDTATLGLAPDQHFSRGISESAVSEPAKSTETEYTKRKNERIEEWNGLRNTLFDAWLDTCSPNSNMSCSQCDNSGLLFRCVDCCTWMIQCHSCLLEKHRFPHLHIFEMWQNGTFIRCTEDTPVWKTNHQCETMYIKEMVIIDEKGRQHVRKVYFCKCEVEPTTLMKLGLWPSSPKYPRVAFHIDLMRWCYSLMLEAHVSLKSFCQSLKSRHPRHHKGYISDEVQDVYKILHTETFEEFKFFCYKTERLAHINDQLDDGTQCHICYKVQTKIYSFDADFQLVRKASSGKSWNTQKLNNHFFLPQEDVDSFVSSYQPGSQRVDADCSEFQAASAVRSKNKSNKLAETAVFGSTCRHGYPKYFFSLRHGERLAYSVFLLEKLLEEKQDPVKLHVMYDIACVLHSHLKKYKPEILEKLRLSIPIFHSYGHKQSCQVLYGPRRMHGLGLTDGESLERLWSYLGNFSKITKEMTPENRVDMLSYALLYYGEKIMDKSAKSLAEKYKKAIDIEHSSRTALHEMLSLHEGVSMDTISKWIEEESMEVQSLRKKECEEKLTLKEEYSLALENYYLCSSSASEICDTNETNSDSNHPTIDKLKETVLKFEKKLAVRWTSDNLLYQQNLKTAKEKKRKNALLGIWKDVSQRLYFLELMKKYAKGQAVSNRLSRQLKNLCTKIRKSVKLYNSIGEPTHTLPSVLTFEAVKDFDSPIWQFFSETRVVSIPFAEKHKVLNLKVLLDRAVEEQEIVKEEMFSLMQWHKDQHKHLQQESAIASAPIKSLLMLEGLCLERKMVDMRYIFSSFVGDLEIPHDFTYYIGNLDLTNSTGSLDCMREEISLVTDAEEEDDESDTSDLEDLDCEEPTE